VRKSLVTAFVGAALVAAPGVANAAVIPTSYFGFTTNAGGRVDDSDRWRGASSGHFKVCGDIVNSSTGIGNDMDIWRDISFMPDPAITYTTLWYTHAYECGSLASSSTNQYYYAGHYRVKETTPHSGYVEARDS
jgi:hypothetical protein